MSADPTRAAAGGPTRIAVIGAGIVGVCCALYLRRDGYDVTLIEREAPGDGASRGNAGALSPGSCVPLSMPGTAHKVPGWLLDPDGPLTIRPRYFPLALPWLIRFARAGRPGRIAAIADALRALHGRTFACYAPLLRAAGVEALVHRTGTLVIYESEAALAAAATEWTLRRERGVPCEAIDGDGLRQLLPDLSDRYRCGMLLPEHGFVAEPYRLTRALADHFVATGGRLVRAQATGWRFDRRRLAAVVTDAGEIAAERAVIAGGAWSAPLARQAGLRVPLESQRGYHVTLPEPGIRPRLPVTDAAAKIYATPMEGGLRVAGTVEFAGLAAPPNWARARRLVDLARRIFPAARADGFTEWMGHRPCLPDSLPAIGPVPAYPDVLCAFGHGHNGMTSGPVTGSLIADLIAGRDPGFDLRPYRPDRF
ncbi:MAG: FAD-dependent oxidoreductase [Rhodospirillales bacterium]|nr:FAD-dependent oxidoreductase [Rhodospirillales bacterium]